MWFILIFHDKKSLPWIKKRNKTTTTTTKEKKRTKRKNRFDWNGNSPSIRDH